MDTSVLTTKLFIPPVRPGLVTRPRLLEKLQTALDHSLTLVSAPAGFGKTTLISEWLHQNAIPAAWLSLEDEDNDPTRFWEYFISALQSLQPDIGKHSLSLLRSSQPVPIETMLTVLLNDVTGIDASFILVLDDYHFIRSIPIHNGVNFCLEHLPHRMHLVIATRADPPLSLPHFRGRGSLLEIGTDDLRFTFEEAAALLREPGCPELSVEDIQAINTRTEGWIVGLKMAVLSLTGEKDIPGFISSFTGSQRYVMDYLMEEVLQKQPLEVQNFLLQTSVLERLTGPLCDAVTGGNDGREMLLGLEKANLFLVPLDKSREWYRYEHLFVDLLRHQLETRHGKETAHELQIKASQWYEKQGLTDDAINHALLAQDWERALRLIYNPAIYVLRWRSLTMYNWLRQIPVELLRKNITLYLSFMWALESAGQYDAAENHLNYLERITSHDNPLLGRIASIRTAIALDKGDLIHAEEYAERALLLLPLKEADAWRGLISVYLGIIYMYRSQYEKAEPLMVEAYEYARQVGNAFNALFPFTWLSLIKINQGKFLQAEEMLKEVVSKSEINLLAGLYAHLILFNLYYEWNDLERASLENERASELTRLSGGLGLIYPYLNMARLSMAQRDTQGALEALEKADYFITENKGGWSSIVPSRFDRAHVAACHVALAVAQNDSESAAKWVGMLSEYNESVYLDSPYYARCLFYLQKGKAATQERLRIEYDKFTEAGLFYITTAIRLGQALLADTSAQTIEFLSEALTRGKDIGLIRTFVDEGPPLAPLLKQAISHGFETEYARKILDMIEAEERQVRQGKLPAAAGFLSEREMDVLRLLADEISNEQIARKLNVSLSTVKTHVHHILEKLEVKDRSQAVFRATELKLL